MISKAQKFFKSRTGIVIVSIIWGVGLATLFKRVCKDNNCIVIKGPSVNEQKKKIYKVDNSCVTFDTHVSKCTNNDIKLT